MVLMVGGIREHQDWTCPRCHMINKHDIKKCEQCGFIPEGMPA